MLGLLGLCGAFWSVSSHWTPTLILTFEYLMLKQICSQYICDFHIISCPQDIAISQATHFSKDSLTWIVGSARRGGSSRLQTVPAKREISEPKRGERLGSCVCWGGYTVTGMLEACFTFTTLSRRFSGVNTRVLKQ